MASERTSLRAVKGTRDLLPPETAVWAAVEDTVRRVFGGYGYGEIRTPILEDTELFVRGVGEASDIVGKEMYTFADKKGRSLSLRPESTAAVARAFVQHGLDGWPSPVRLFYVGPHFRYERPQKGRYRQFHQIGAELIGDAGPWSDAELLLMLVRFLGELDFTDLVVRLNTVGDRASRALYADALRGYFEPKRQLLGEDSQRRLATNPLRILDTKVPGERELLGTAPRLEEFLSPECREHFTALCSMLDEHRVRYLIDERLVRGLDYYTRTVFEIASEDLGAQDAILGGGRYDGLIAELGGAEVPGIGFAIGQDRLIEVLPKRFRERVAPSAPVLVVAVGEVSPRIAVELAEELREQGLALVCELSPTGLKPALRRASRLGCRHVLLVGEDEMAANTVTIKDFESGTQSTVARDEVARWLIQQSRQASKRESKQENGQ